MICTCGRHKHCKPVRLSDEPIESHTEYSDHFVNMPTSVIRGKPAPQELSVGGAFYGDTENRDKYTEHTLGPRYKIKKPEYVPNKAKLESVTTQRENYKAWVGVEPPPRRKQLKWAGTTGMFDGSTTSKRDFIEMPLAAHYVRKQAKYVKSGERMDGVSTQKSDYQPWAVAAVPVRRKQTDGPPKENEDRDFKSTSNSSYVGHNIVRELAKAPQSVTTDRKAKFEGGSTAQDAYKAWDLPSRYQRHRAEYSPTAAALDPTTTYNNSFVPKSASRYIHPAQVYAPNLVKFDGMSTNKADFKLPQKQVRTKDFSPLNVYQIVKDDRDFVSTTQGQHTPKPLPRCPGENWKGKETMKSRDGHVHLVKKVAIQV